MVVVVVAGGGGGITLILQYIRGDQKNFTHTVGDH